MKKGNLKFKSGKHILYILCKKSCTIGFGQINSAFVCLFRLFIFYINKIVLKINIIAFTTQYIV